MIDADRIRGVLLGLALGDALGSPVDGMSHQNIRTHVRGVKGLDTPGPRGPASPGIHTARARELAAVLDGDAAHKRALLAGLSGAAGAACAAPAGVTAAERGLDDTSLVELLSEILGSTDAECLAAAVGQARAVALALAADEIDGERFLGAVADAAGAVPGGTRVPAAVRALIRHVDETPLDLHDSSGGTGDCPDTAFPFAVAMFAREPALVEATLLSSINVGGATAAVGAIVGALVGAFNGAGAFPAAWRDAVPAVAIDGDVAR
jgi:ADP-ribosylglycohydrolase